MVVQHNLTAMNSNRLLGLTTASQAKSTEKLSSGYKINRAADDAAGLSISEKMRKQVRGLTQASANAQDGISTVQTAEGALTEVHDMLQRMNELAVKASNGTMSENDRSYVQSEIDQLVTEIDRVATTTKFNETYLLKGNNKGSVGELTYTTAKTALIDNIKGAGGQDFGSITDATGTISLSLKTLKEGSNSGSGTSDLDGTELQGKKTNYEGKTLKLGNTSYVFVQNTTLQSGAGVNDKKLSVTDAVDELNKIKTTNVKAFDSLEGMMSAIKSEFGTDIKSINSYLDGQAGSATMKLKVETFADLNDAVDISLHVGADSSSANKITMNIAQMGARGLGINGLNVSGSKADNATEAIDTIASAIQKVSAQRSSLGAVQNRLEHTINNLDNVAENTTSAESQIRDTDMATEMVKYSNNNILSQAGQAMLAQANQSNQGVLSLLG